MRSPALFSLSAALMAVTCSSVLAATAVLKTSDGAQVGTVLITETPNGILLRAEFTKLPAGAHGFHIHETGKCEPTFEAAGEHIAGRGGAHGHRVEGGPHAGDLTNVHVPASGSVTVEMSNPALSFQGGEGSLFDTDGAAIVVHANADDYEEQPAGGSGDRIACGVVER